MDETAYPNIWGPGQLFAFSGIDGETDWFHPFVASTLAEDVGLLFHLTVPRRLWCEPTSMVVDHLEPHVVGGDCIDFLIRSTRGQPFPLRYLFLDRGTVIGETSVHMPPRVRAEGSALVSIGPDVTMHSSRGEHTALVTEVHGEKLMFAFSFSPESAREALEQARRGLGTNLPGLLQRRLLFYGALWQPAGSDERRRAAAAKAFSVLKTNIESPQGVIPCRWSTPDRWPHRDMWLWDSCFHVLGYRMFSPELAVEVLDAVLATQGEDGFIAHWMSPTGMSDVTQPPLLAWAYYELFRFTGNRALIEQPYDRLARFVHWVLQYRREGEGGLLAWKTSDDPLCRCPESGMDNSPRFDGGAPVFAVDLNSYVVSEMNCLKEMALLLKNYGEASSWARQAKQLSDGMNDLLWDEADGFYYDRSLDGERVRLKAASGFLPMFAGAADERRAAKLLHHLQDPNEFWTAFPVPSVARSDDAYQLDMWRGPAWLNLDFLIVEGLKRCGFRDAAARLAEKVLAGVEHWYGRLGSLYEFYDPDGRVPPPELDRKQCIKQGVGMPIVSDYNGSAACYLALAAEKL